MSDASWPAELPSGLRLEGQEGSLGSGVIETAMDSGPVKRRRRYTAAPEPFSGTLLFTEAQMLVFRVFWRDTLRHGTLPFTWTHPLTGEPCRCRFSGREAPGWSRSGSLYLFSMTLEVLP